MSSEFNTNSMYKKELADAYGITLPTLKKWLEASPTLWDKLNYTATHMLTPKQVKLIIEHLGEPDIIN